VGKNRICGYRRTEALKSQEAATCKKEWGRTSYRLIKEAGCEDLWGQTQKNAKPSSWLGKWRVRKPWRRQNGQIGE